DNQHVISIDYSYPVSKNLLIETGAKTTFQNITSDVKVSALDVSANKYLPDTTQSYHLNYNMKIYAGYVSASFPLFHYLNVKAGMRYEYTNVGIDFPNTSIPAYNSFVPSIVFSHDLKKKASIKLAYSHRIERPDY